MKASLLLAFLACPILLAPAHADVVLDEGFEAIDGIGSGPPTSFGSWGGDRSTIVPSQGGLDPFEGSRMLRFDATELDRASGGQSDVWYLVDLAPFAQAIASGTIEASASAWFNRVEGDASTDTLFQLELRVYGGTPDAFPRSVGSWLARAQTPVLSDGLIATWEEASVRLAIPTDAAYLAVLVLASENVANDSTSPELDGHFVDGVRVELDLPTPIPEPGLLALVGLALSCAVEARGRRPRARGPRAVHPMLV